MKSLIRSHSPLALFSLAMVALMCVLPFLVPIHRNPLTTFYGEWLAAALGLAASLLLLRPKSWQPFQFPLVAMVPLGLIVVLGIQVWAGLAIYWQHHFLVGLYLLWAALLVVLGAELRREFGLEKLVPVLAWAVLIGGLLCSLIVILQAAGVGNDYIVPRKAAGYGANLLQINHLANYLGLALASLLFLAGTGRLRYPWAALIAVLLLFPLALTGQRMGWIYVVMLSVGAWLVGRKSNDNAWRALWLIPGFIAMQLLIPLLASEMAGMFRLAGAPPMPAQKVIEGFQGSSVRLQLYQEAWQVFLSHPWLGAGWGQFAWHDFLLADRYPNHEGWASHSHNLFTQIMAECGLIGLLVLFAGMGYWLKPLKSQAIDAPIWFLLGMLSVIGVHSLLEYPLWYSYFLALAALLLGLTENSPPTIKLDLGSVLAIGLLIFGMFSLGNIVWQYNKVETWQYAWLSASNRSATLNAMSAERDKSLFVPYIDNILVRALPDQPPYLEPKLANNTQVMRYRPGIREVYAQAWLLYLSGQSAEAAQQLKLALIRFPQGKKAFMVLLYPRLRGGDVTVMPLIDLMADRRTEEGVPVISIPGFRP